MPLHPQCQEVLRRVAEPPDSGPPCVATARERERRRFEQLAGPRAPVADVRDIHLPGPAGAVPARVYVPLGPPPIGALLWFHGGGWVVGSVHLCDDQARALAGASGCVVVSVDYRLAPEHPFPAALHDCLAAFDWVAENPAAIGVHGDRIAVGGDSAGANLATALALVTRDRDSHRPSFQLLAYPVLARTLDTDSRRSFADGYWLTAELLEWCWSQYLQAPDDAHHPLASPLLADAYAGLPPAHVLTAEYDPLRDEGELYARRLRTEGVPVDLRRYAGMLHGFLSCAGVVGEARHALNAAGRAVRDALSDPAQRREREPHQRRGAAAP